MATWIKEPAEEDEKFVSGSADSAFRLADLQEMPISPTCGYPCKHKFAAILQLGEILERIEKNYADTYA